MAGAVRQGAGQLKDQAVDWAKQQAQDWLASQLSNIPSWFSTMSANASGLFGILQTLQIGNEILFSTLSNINRKLAFGANLGQQPTPAPAPAPAAQPATA